MPKPHLSFDMQMSIGEMAAWMAMAHCLPRWLIERKNRLLIAILHEKKMNLEGFFAYYPIQWQKEFALSEKEIHDLQQASAKRLELTHLATQLNKRGIGLIPLHSSLYSPILKHNLKTKQAPALLYVIGNSELLQKDAVAIVGSRKADGVSLYFTDHLSKKLTQQGKVIVSGFANGIDKQALNSALGYGGQSIIVLPQGIATFNKGQAQYRREIEQGNLIALSTFQPQAVWDKGLAMARNHLIYGLSSQIYVAQTAEKGGTWTGAMHGLKQKRKIFVRMPHENEKNANLLLIQQGASAVDFWGTELSKEQTTEQTMKQIIAPKQTDIFLF